MYQKAVAAFILALVCGASHADSYDPTTGRITIDSIPVGNTLYTNVVITLGSIVSVGGATEIPAGYISQGGLTWSPISGAAYHYEDAEAYCSTATFNGLTGWRLPTLTELSGITVQPTTLLTNSQAGHYAIATGGLYGSGTANGKGWGYVWSSTATLSAATDNFPGYWGVFFADNTNALYPYHAGNVASSAPGDWGYVTCVR